MFIALLIPFNLQNGWWRSTIIFGLDSLEWLHSKILLHFKMWWKRYLWIDYFLKQVCLFDSLKHLDGPFMAPVPFRGKTCHPGYIPHIAEKIAELKKVSVDSIYETTRENTKKMYGFWRSECRFGNLQLSCNVCFLFLAFCCSPSKSSCIFRVFSFKDICNQFT